MNRLLLSLAVGMAVTGFVFTGCKSSQMEFRNPFASKPKADIKSPVDMDDINLKAPPERYTTDENLSETGKKIQKDSLAQQGKYRSSSSQETASVSEGRSERLAMNETSLNGTGRSASDKTPKTASRDLEGGYEEAPVSGYADVPGFDSYSDSERSGDDSAAPFTPGSIGDY